MLPRWPGLTATHMRALRKNCVSPGSLKAISANRYTDRACHPEHFWIAARCAACSHTPSASGCPHRVKLRQASMSVASPLIPQHQTFADVDCAAFRSPMRARPICSSTSPPPRRWELSEKTPELETTVPRTDPLAARPPARHPRRGCRQLHHEAPEG